MTLANKLQEGDSQRAAARNEGQAQQARCEVPRCQVNPSSIASKPFLRSLRMIDVFERSQTCDHVANERLRGGHAANCTLRAHMTMQTPACSA